MKLVEPTERDIQNVIIEWINTHMHAMAWPNHSVGLFDPVKRVYRTPAKNFRKGVADILGIWQGLPLAIEVKKPKGKATEEQLKFLADFRDRGGMGFIAHSLEEAISLIQLFYIAVTSKDTKPPKVK